MRIKIKIRKRKIIFIIVIVALICGGGYAYKHLKKRTGTTAEATATEYVKVAKNSIVETVTAQGVIETKDYVEVGAQISGQVKKMYFEAGDLVKKGDLLADIDPEIYQAKVFADRARLRTLSSQMNQAMAQAELAKSQYARNEQLTKADAISKEQMEGSTSNLKVANAAVESYKSQIQEEEYNLKTDEANLRYTKIFAPMTGLVLSLAIHEGQTINSNQQAPTILIIANLDTMTLHAKVTEADVNKLSAGTPLFFTTLGAGQRRWQGKIRRIMPTAESAGDVVLYGILIDVENKDHQLMHGMSTQVFFIMNSADDILTIPVEALNEHLEEKDDKTGHAYMVKTRTGEKLIRTGLSDRVNVEVKSGLALGDEVLVSKP